MMLLWKILDLLLLVVPMIQEYFKNRRAEGEKAADYVRRNQAEKLKTTELVLEEKGDELSRLSRSRLRITRELLKRAAIVRDKRLRNKGDKPAD
jgi:hypothetical protein